MLAKNWKASNARELTRTVRSLGPALQDGFPVERSQAADPLECLAHNVTVI